MVSIQFNHDAPSHQFHIITAQTRWRTKFKRKNPTKHVHLHSISATRRFVKIQMLPAQRFLNIDRAWFYPRAHSEKSSCSQARYLFQYIPVHSIAKKRFQRYQIWRHISDSSRKWNLNKRMRCLLKWPYWQVRTRATEPMSVVLMLQVWFCYLA